jgi:hypothetical protein
LLESDQGYPAADFTPGGSGTCLRYAHMAILGKLYKARRIRFQNPGIQLLDNSSWSPGK